MLFSLEQSSDCFAILRNLLEKHYSFPGGRPADAMEDFARSSPRIEAHRFLIRSSPRIAVQSCGIYSKAMNFNRIKKRKQIL